jgi:hypothetical protein
MHQSGSCEVRQQKLVMGLSGAGLQEPSVQTVNSLRGGGGKDMRKDIHDTGTCSATKSFQKLDNVKNLRFACTWKKSLDQITTVK